MKISPFNLNAMHNQQQRDIFQSVLNAVPIDLPHTKAKFEPFQKHNITNRFFKFI